MKSHLKDILSEKEAENRLENVLEKVCKQCINKR